jgi:hypothetical protein
LQELTKCQIGSDPGYDLLIRQLVTVLEKLQLEHPYGIDRGLAKVRRIVLGQKLSKGSPIDSLFC